MDKTGLKQFQVANYIFGITDKNLSNKIKRNTIDLFAIIKWAGNAKVDLEYILTGKEPKFVEDKNDPEDSTFIYKEGMPFDDDPVIAELLKEARKVLKSGNNVAFDALERNIRYFSLAIETEKRLQTLEARMARIEQTQAQADRIRSEDDPEKKQEIVSMREPTPSA
jgi:hypothetical protein